ncbi:MAG: hypothetical protein U0232_02885 [Thermomicrobiales bacterium]
MSPTVNIVGQLLLLLVLGGAFGTFFWRLNQLYRLAIAGATTTVPGDQATRLRRFGKMVLAQTKMFERPGIGLAHFLIFWGFIVLTLALTQVILDGLIHGLRLPIVSSRIFVGMNDLFAFSVLASLGYALYRRLGQRPWQLTTMPDAFIIIGMITGHVTALMLSEGFAAAAYGTEGVHWSIAGLILGPVFEVFGHTGAEVGYIAFWWIHLLLVMGLLVYIPLSKHLHILTGPVNVYFKSSKPKGELKKIENIEEAEHFGVSKVEQFTWKDILDGYACTRCGRCATLPRAPDRQAARPEEIVVDLRLAAYAHGGAAHAWRATSAAAASPPRNAADRRVNRRGRTLELHDLHGLCGSLPGGDRACAEDRGHAPLAGAGGATDFPVRVDRRLQQPGAQQQPVRLPRPHARRLGQGSRHQGGRRQPRRTGRCPLLGRCYGSFDSATRRSPARCRGC